MDAMILSAGLGKRLRPLTDTLPKPLLKVGSHRLIEYHLFKLARAGYSKAVINTSYLSNLFEKYIGDGSAYGLSVVYSHEGDKPLETGGGIQNALGLFDSDPFLIVNADVFTDFDFGQLTLPRDSVAHLAVVDNPNHNLQGDFILRDGVIHWPGSDKSTQTFTYSGIAKVRRSLFSSTGRRNFPLTEVLDAEIQAKHISAQLYRGRWYDVGSPERLDEVRSLLTGQF